eukprot:gene12086-8313_t
MDHAGAPVAPVPTTLVGSRCLAKGWWTCCWYVLEWRGAEPRPLLSCRLRVQRTHQSRMIQGGPGWDAGEGERDADPGEADAFTCVGLSFGPKKRAPSASTRTSSNACVRSRCSLHSRLREMAAEHAALQLQLQRDLRHAKEEEVRRMEAKLQPAPQQLDILSRRSAWLVRVAAELGNLLLVRSSQRVELAIVRGGGLLELAAVLTISRDDPPSKYAEFLLHSRVGLLVGIRRRTAAEPQLAESASRTLMLLVEIVQLTGVGCHELRERSAAAARRFFSSSRNFPLSSSTRSAGRPSLGWTSSWLRRSELAIARTEGERLERVRHSYRQQLLTLQDRSAARQREYDVRLLGEESVPSPHQELCPQGKPLARYVEYLSGQLRPAEAPCAISVQSLRQVQEETAAALQNRLAQPSALMVSSQQQLVLTQPSPDPARSRSRPPSLRGPDSGSRVGVGHGAHDQLPHRELSLLLGCCRGRELLGAVSIHESFLLIELQYPHM